MNAHNMFIYILHPDILNIHDKLLLNSENCKDIGVTRGSDLGP